MQMTIKQKKCQLHLIENIIDRPSLEFTLEAKNNLSSVIEKVLPELFYNMLEGIKRELEKSTINLIPVCSTINLFLKKKQKIITFIEFKKKKKKKILQYMLLRILLEENERMASTKNEFQKKLQTILSCLIDILWNKSDELTKQLLNNSQTKHNKKQSVLKFWIQLFNHKVNQKIDKWNKLLTESLRTWFTRDDFDGSSFINCYHCKSVMVVDRLTIDMSQSILKNV
ncbi:hypothetical protein RFI_40315 [Reticulomyxa filosa]|uniref:Uncharacterized protein n=1 Tax=Reticulomyxa filosa TaxID=46433 RepID=X6L6Z1_RETFI|nr:hypothetical protein RFI_40315 [Reticulomyxa filosa]|eukprot:ETN97217.1 hypothetical protein RFI_40315 [Reticulomyxa filosa]